jgi:hypothetical protein
MRTKGSRDQFGVSPRVQRLKSQILMNLIIAYAVVLFSKEYRFILESLGPVFILNG